MKKILVLAAVVVGLVIIAAAFFVFKLMQRRQQPAKFKQRWLEIQRLCASKETWSLAVINADRLLENALKRRGIKGHSMGERLVSAQRIFTNNDGVWYAHNLAKKLLSDTAVGLREAEAKKSLIGVRQALRDLGMLNGR